MTQLQLPSNFTERLLTVIHGSLDVSRQLNPINAFSDFFSRGKLLRGEYAIYQQAEIPLQVGHKAGVSHLQHTDQGKRKTFQPKSQCLHIESAFFSGG